jgi:hypothetical protein
MKALSDGCRLLCRVTAGGGVIVVGEGGGKLLAGDAMHVTLKTDHWMEPDGYIDALLVCLKEW